MKIVTEKNKENSKSLYLYTALIFIVALVMIIISFFGQSNLEKTNKAIQNQKTITEKSAALSEENVRLVEENIALEKTIAEKDTAILNLNASIELKDKKLNSYNTLMSAYAYHSLKNYTKAKELLDTIEYEALEGDAKVLYTQILNDVNKRKEGK